MMKTATDRTANSFELVAREWLAKHPINWVASHADKIIRRLERGLSILLSDNWHILSEVKDDLLENYDKRFNIN